MKAIVVREFGGPEQMKLEETPIPPVGEGELLIKIAAAGVNPVDAYIRTGTHAQKPGLPYTPGKDGAGIIEEAGAGVSGFAKGSRVYVADSISGTYAEYCLCFENQVNLLPENISFEQGAGVFVPYATAYRALFDKARAAAGECVLIHGASGGVGLAAIQWAKRSGLCVIGTASTQEGRSLVADEGADFVFDHSSPSYLQEIIEASGGNGPDLILEMLANVNLQKDVDIVRKFGRIVVIGNRGSLEFNPRGIMGKDASIFGLALFNASSGEMKEIHRNIAAGLGEGWLRPRVGKEFPLADAAAAHHAVIEGKAYGKVILKPENYG